MVSILPYLQFFQNAPTYSARVVSYARKVSTKYPPGLPESFPPEEHTSAAPVSGHIRAPHPDKFEQPAIKVFKLCHLL